METNCPSIDFQTTQCFVAVAISFIFKDVFIGLFYQLGTQLR